MPLVRVDLRAGRSAAELQAISRVIHDALVSVGVPVKDRFQLFTEHRPETFVFDDAYLGISRTEGLVVIQITWNEGRSTDQKRALYKAIADGLHATVGTRREDVLVNLVEVKRENWSFGNGEAQYAT